MFKEKWMLKELKRVQHKISDIRRNINNLHFPMYSGECNSRYVSCLAEDLELLIRGKAETQLFFEKHNMSKDYLKKLGEYLIKVTDLQNIKDLYMKELDNLEAQERSLKQDLGIK